MFMFAAMQRRFRQVFCALKEHGSVKYAKIATFGGFNDLDHIIVKATAPDDSPLPERYINELLNIFSICPSSSHSFCLSFTSRFGRTHCWKVALKCLILLHRLLRSLPEHSPFRAELLWSRSNGLLSLYPCHFRDEFSSNPEDYTIFIRSYAHLLNEALGCFAFDPKEHKNETLDEDENEAYEEGGQLKDKTNQVNEMLETLPLLQTLIDRVIECRPTGAAARSSGVQSAMQYIVCDSFKFYSTFKKGIAIVLDNLIQMPYKSCNSSFEIYKKAAKQADELCEFYEWCQVEGLCGGEECPFIEKIPDIQIRALESFLNGMWQLTETSCSSVTSPSSINSCTTDDQDEEYKREYVISTKWVKLEESERFLGEFEKEEMKPLIQIEDDDNDWEVLLDTSIDFCVRDEETKQCQVMEVYSPNPFINPSPLLLM